MLNMPYTLWPSLNNTISNSTGCGDVWACCNNCDKVSIPWQCHTFVQVPTCEAIVYNANTGECYLSFVLAHSAVHDIQLNEIKLHLDSIFL